MNRLCYAKYSCEEKFPLGCKNTRSATGKSCQVCGFPAILACPAQLQTDWAGYRVEVHEFLRMRGNGLLYRGRQLGDRQPVILKEYLLPSRYFTRGEAKSRWDRFRQLATMELADGRPLEFRLLVPDDICIQTTDPNDPDSSSLGRCYQIVSGEQMAYPSLREYLEKHGRLSPERVRWILAQVLQSLVCLHGQKLRFRSGAVRRGIAHGNLNLDTLLLESLDDPSLVYLSDLSLWENAFDPQAPWEEWVDSGTQATSPTSGTAFVGSQDLKDLGAVAVALLSGEEIDGTPPTAWGSSLSSHQQLNEFVLTLLGERGTTFKSSEVAADALPSIPLMGGAIAAFPAPAEPAAKRKANPKFVLALVAALLPFLLGACLGIWLWRRSKAVAVEPKICCFDLVKPLPLKALYLGEVDGVWDFVFQKADLVSSGQSLLEVVRAERAELEEWCYQAHSKENPTSVNADRERGCTSYPRLGAEFEGKSLIDLTHFGTVDFAIVNPGDARFDAEYGVFPFAYDSLVVFVAFNYQEREMGLTQKLNGTISFEQLRQLYTGKIARWRQLDYRLPDLPVKLYAPQEEAALTLFEERVLQDPEAISEFRTLLARTDEANDLSPRSILEPEAGEEESRITRLRTPQLLQQTIADFENRSPSIGSIGFDSLARVFNQCSIYPLALRSGDSSASEPTSPLVMNDGRTISPRIDLCREKGNYRPNHRAIAPRRYPLSYPLAVVYRRDNRRPEAGKSFARLMKTDRGQCLLRKAGLTPLAPDILTCTDDE